MQSMRKYSTPYLTAVAVYLSGVAYYGGTTSFAEVSNDKSDLADSGGPTKAPIETESQAIERAERVIGSVGRSKSRPSAQTVVLKDDDTPFLHKKLCDRPLWKTTLHNWSIDLRSSPPGQHDKYSRTVEVLLDPVDGQVLKITATWPEAEATLGPRPSAKSAETQLGGPGAEHYLDFPSEPPQISFTEAIDALQRGGRNPLVAKQIIGRWVVWSNLDSPPMAMWVITLRGIPPMRPYLSEARGLIMNPTMRFIVDPIEKRWVKGSSGPVYVKE